MLVGLGAFYLDGGHLFSNALLSFHYTLFIVDISDGFYAFPPRRYDMFDISPELHYNIKRGLSARLVLVVVLILACVCVCTV